MPADIATRCCIAGGGPAGMMLGFLLARAGVEVAVLEKHADFFRDFRGDTIHPSTLELMHELGLLDEFLRLPHSELREATGLIGATRVRLADFSKLSTHCKFIAMMPQWDFLNFLARQGARYPAFKLMMQAEATDLIIEGARVAGLRAKTPEGAVAIRADLVVGCDGRHSTVRERAGFQVENLGAPMDVFWLRISRRPDDRNDALGRIAAGHMFVTLDRGDYWQCAYVIPKGSAEEVQRQGLPAFRAKVRELVPWFENRVDELKTWDDVNLLTVAVDRLKRWYRPGLLCIGDAAHAMSPIGGVGVNLAVQDAVATANLLAAPLAERRLKTEDLAAVQRRREWPMRVTQRMQLAIQNNVISRALASTEVMRPPLAMRLIDRFSLLRRIPARLLGIGVRPEHVRTREASARKVKSGSGGP